MAERKHDLYIGVNNDLSPFEVDLNALTRGLVVVGQSGCGKSFLIGRLIEEIIRKTTEKSRILIVDSNSDFAYGMRLKTKPEFKSLYNKYNSGLISEQNFLDFWSLELEKYRGLAKIDQLDMTQLFGRNEDFNLSWEWLLEDVFRFLRIVKGNQNSVGYHSALDYMTNVINEHIKNTNGNHDLIRWNDATKEAFMLRRDLPVEENYFKDEEVLKEMLIKLELDEIFELLYDVIFEKDSTLYRMEESINGIPERLFTDSRINCIEVETLSIKRDRLKLVTYVLLNRLIEHTTRIEECRQLRFVDEEAYKEKEKTLKRTFILIDEAHNFAPIDSNDPHEKILGELMHTIAAEGRKYGLHLILATQRPNKVKSGLLGECDNAIIMKMNSRQDLEHLANEMRILDVKLLEPCLHFQGQGNAMAVGEMTRMAPYVQLFKSAPRRTVEGGVDIEGF